MRDVIAYMFGNHNMKRIKRFSCAAEHKSEKKVEKNHQ